MISIGFQFDYELNSKNHPKKIIKHFGFFFRFFWFVCRFVFDFFVFFWFFLDCFFDFFWIFFDFNWIFFESLFFSIFFDFFWFFSISIGFFWISIGFFHERWRSDKPEKKKKKSKNIKNQIQNPFFLILIGSIPKSNRIEIQKNQKKSKKLEEKYFFCLLHNSQS